MTHLLPAHSLPAQPPIAQSPLAQLQALIDQSELIYDPKQANAAAQLSILWQQIQTRPLEISRNGGFWDRIKRIIKRISMPAPDSQTDLMPIKGIYLYGDVGRGKSLLMDIFYNQLEFDLKRRVHFHHFMLEVHGWLQAWRMQDSHDQQDPLPKFAAEFSQKTLLLCFDEFHVKDIADAMILSRLFQALLDQGVVMVMTSNQAPDALYKDGLQRSQFLPFIALLKQSVNIIELNADQDFRRISQKNPHSPQQWPINISLMPYCLNQKGRKIDFKTADPKAKYLSVGFDELCLRPLGVVDYIALCEAFEYIEIPDMILLTPELKSPAKRFIHFIDVAYEAGISLKITLPVHGKADDLCKIDDLCKVDALREEYRRTASRLHQML
ncbi:MAG: cell division protein ZapE [Alphaproteobacteria bacterium]